MVTGSFPETRLRQAGIGAARIAALRAVYVTLDTNQQHRFRAIVASGNDETLRRSLDPLGVPESYVTRAENVRHYLHVTYGTGQPGGPTFTIGRSFTTAPLDSVDYDTAEAFDRTAGLYRVPLTGYYDVNASMRAIDGAEAGINVGLGVDAGNTDSPNFVWAATSGATRNTFTYARNAHFTEGQQVRLFSYVDAPSELLFSAASLSLSLIGQG